MRMLSKEVCCVAQYKREQKQKQEQEQNNPRSLPTVEYYYAHHFEGAQNWVVPELNLVSLADVVLTSEFEFTVNKFHFLKQVESSFTHTSIERQFSVDVPRCRVYFNSHLVQDPYVMTLFLFDWYSCEDARRVMMLTTQAIMGLPFELLVKNINSQNCYVADGCAVDSKSSNTFHIDVTLEHNHQQLEARKRLRIFTLVDNECVDLFHVFVHLQYSSDSDFVRVRFRFEKKIEVAGKVE